MRWRDCVRKDLKKFGIDESRWYRSAQDRSGWRSECRIGLRAVTEARVAEDERKRRTREEGNCGRLVINKLYQCLLSGRSFQRKQDIDRHRCVTTRLKQNYDIVCH